jgi:hypothetical protein
VQWLGIICRKSLYTTSTLCYTSNNKYHALLHLHLAQVHLLCHDFVSCASVFCVNCNINDKDHEFLHIEIMDDKNMVLKSPVLKCEEEEVQLHR